MGDMRGLIAVAALMFGCGGDPVRHVVDAAPQPDGTVAIDAPPQVQTVTLTVQKDGAPQAGIRVYYLNADSSLVASMTTNAAGVTSATMAAGGYVVALDPLGLGGKGEHRISMFAGVKPGDHLQLHNPPLLDSTAISFTMTIPTDATIGVAHYMYATSCSSGEITPVLAAVTVSGPVTLYGCNGVADIMIYTTDTNLNVLSSFYVANQAVADAQPLDLSAQTYASVPARTYTVSNHPAGNTNGVYIGDTSVSPRGVIYPGPSRSITGDPAVTQVPTPTFTGALHVVRSDFNNAGIAAHHFIDWGPYATTYALDLGARILPDFATRPVFEQPTHSITWNETGTNEPDFVFADGSGYRASTSWYWQIVGPRTGAYLTLPLLPTDVFDYNFGPADFPQIYRVIQAKTSGGYDAVRAEVLSMMLGNNDLEGFVAPGSGSITYVVP
jgi:hypothetical protein